jgi:thiol-disulfide isomerase/thioredoxin
MVYRQVWLLVEHLQADGISFGAGIWSPRKDAMNPRSSAPRAREAHSVVFGRYCVAALLSALLIAVISASACAKGQGQAYTGTTIHFVRNPDPAPDFKLDSLDGKPLSLAGARGKVILLNFWATWCGPCRIEIPDLIALQNKYKDRLQIIGLTVDEDDPDMVKKVVEKAGINYPVGMASPEVRVQYGGVSALPTSFMLDSEGRVMQKHEGLHDPLLYELEIRSLLGLPVNAKVETFEDTGQIFLAHADRANELPGVDLSKLTPEQKRVALHRFNAETCTCGCKFTLAQCRIYDQYCATSKPRTAEIVAEIRRRAGSKEPPAKPETPPTPQNEPPDKSRE